ncbi:MAG: hypothetical protein GY953_41910, partial [bacterium]|nr:hypothetical protein [bacterium]
ANLERTRGFLEDAISLEVTGEVDNDRLDVEVLVMNNTGHKLPTAFPSRRVWLHLVVKGRDGKTVFESGALDNLAGNEPHRQHVDQPDQTVIYEAELGDSDGNVTVSLLRAATYLKDNRLLPVGFDLSKPGADKVAPAGVDGDEDFQPGSDKVSYSVTVPPDRGPFHVQVEALYQSVKPSHSAAFVADRSPEEAEFLKLAQRHSTPAVMTRKEILVKR